MSSGLTAAELRTRFPKMPEKTVLLNAVDGVAEGSLPLPANKTFYRVTVPLPPSSPTPSEKTPPRPKAGAPRIRQRKDGDGKNKLERAFGEYLQMSRRLCTRNLEMMLGADDETMIVRFNSVSFELANGLRFKPDYTANMSHAWEVKGPWASRDAFPRLKMAARLYPEIQWFLATRRKGGGWDIQHVLP